MSDLFILGPNSPTFTGPAGFFGFDIARAMTNWADVYLAPWFYAQFPEGSSYAAFICDAGYLQHCHYNSLTSEVSDALIIGLNADSERRNGLLTNIDGKARYSQRTGWDSARACSRGSSHTVRPGDFPYDGVLVDYRGFGGGGSGVRKEADPEVWMRIVDYLADNIMGPIVDYVRAVVDWARSQSGMDVGSWRFMQGDLRHLRSLEVAYEARHGNKRPLGESYRIIPAALDEPVTMDDAARRMAQKVDR